MLQIVLIVAKCIVNRILRNSSICLSVVLIVAKCIVNKNNKLKRTFYSPVLIVAKCIVNNGVLIQGNKIKIGINSSKVYCKYTYNEQGRRH